MTSITINAIPDSKVHGANMGPTWGDGTQVGNMLALWILLSGMLLPVLTETNATHGDLTEDTSRLLPVPNTIRSLTNTLAEITILSLQWSVFAWIPMLAVAKLMTTQTSKFPSMFCSHIILWIYYDHCTIRYVRSRLPWYEILRWLHRTYLRNWNGAERYMSIIHLNDAMLQLCAQVTIIMQIKHFAGNICNVCCLCFEYMWPQSTENSLHLVVVINQNKVPQTSLTFQVRHCNCSLSFMSAILIINSLVAFIPPKKIQMEAIVVQAPWKN